jgi:hypothetical protein
MKAGTHISRCRPEDGEIPSRQYAITPMQGHKKRMRDEATNSSRNGKFLPLSQIDLK